jgi:hypothetical protein
MKITIELDTDNLDSLSYDYLIRLIQQQSYYDITPEQEQSHPISEISKQKLFLEIFKALFERGDVNKNVLFGELIGTGKFNIDDANKFLKLLLSNGEIYERRKDYYAKT